MAAHHLPMNALVQQFTIDPTFTPTPQGRIIASTTQIEFTNNSGATISITFNPNPPGPALFPNITGLANRATSPLQTPQAANGSVNYFITPAGGAAYGPFSIQVGTGPIYVQVTLGNGSGFSAPDQIAVPAGGALEMINMDPHEYGISWPGIPTNPFNPYLTDVGGAGGNVLHTATAAAGSSYTYKITPKQPTPVLGIGGGRVIIQA